MDIHKQEYIELCEGEVAAFLDCHQGNVIYYYIRDKKSKAPCGVLVAARTEENGPVLTGWSLCHKGDKFIKALALRKAIDRAENGTSRFVKVPTAVREAYINKFSDMIESYFHKVLTN